MLRERLKEKERRERGEDEEAKKEPIVISKPTPEEEVRCCAVCLEAQVL